MAGARALDLGSTRLKAAVLTPEGVLTPAGEAEAPPLSGTGPVREGDASAYVDAALDVLNAAGRPDLPLGIASQRSSFALWDAATGRPVTPLVSWQDRRAEDWCRAHAHLAEIITRRTGLVLSPHYAGPKLAVLLAADPALRAGLAQGALRFGTLDTWLLWRLTNGRIHHTDLSMAARTLLVDLEAGDWAPALLTAFGVPRAGLPAIGPSTGLTLPLPDGGVAAATVADQGAAALAAVGGLPGAALVNLGTGGFVLVPVPGPHAGPPGYLTGPLCRTGSGTAWAVEGTINGIGAGVGPGTTPIPDADPTPDALCIPDTAGIGAPHWRADLGPVENDALRALDGTDRRRVVLEGIAFRVAEIVADLADAVPIHRLVLSGGLSHEPFLGPALAACTGLPTDLLGEPEATLLGAARLAAGLPPAPPVLESLPAEGGYMRDKVVRWNNWKSKVLKT